MAQPLSLDRFTDAFNKIELAFNGLLPLMLADDEVRPEAYHAAQHALEWVQLCLNELSASYSDTQCSFCKHEFRLAESPIACPACGYATDNWIGDEDSEQVAQPSGSDCDGNLFDELIEQYGSQLQGLSRRQKLFLMISIAGGFWAAEGEENLLTEPDFSHTIARIHRNLTADERESLLVTLAHQVREQRPAPKVRENPDIALTQILEITD